MEFLIEKDLKKDQSIDLKPIDRLIEGLKMFQSLYPYLLNIIGNPLFTKWYETMSGDLFFSTCLLPMSMGHSFNDNFAATRCTSTRLFNNFFFFPHKAEENVISNILKRQSSFSNISEFVSVDYKNIVVTRYDMLGGPLPDHTFITVSAGKYLIIVQSFYYAYNMNSKYGVILLSGDEIKLFQNLMKEYKEKHEKYKSEKERLEKKKEEEILSNISADDTRLDLFILDLNFEKDIKPLNILFQKYTGIDTEKHCVYLNNVSVNIDTNVSVSSFRYSKSHFLENVCQKLSYVLKFLTIHLDFAKIKEDQDIFMIQSFPQVKQYQIFNSFVDQVDFTRVNSDFIKYTGFEFASNILELSMNFGKMCNIYNVLCMEVLNINILFTGINYMFDLFNCSGIVLKKYGDILDSYTGNTWSKEFYKKIIKTSKIIREIYQKNRELSFKEIVEIVEKQIKLNTISLDSLQFLNFPNASPLPSPPEIKPLVVTSSSLSTSLYDEDEKLDFSKPIIWNK
jgi:hypothetical protein